MDHCHRFVLLTMFAVTTVSAVNNEHRSEDSKIFLEFIPTPDSNDPKNTLIYYKANNISSVRHWTNIIDDFLFPYHKTGSDGGEIRVLENRMVCTPTSHELKENQVCDVDVDEIYPCTSANLYNYHKAGPCVFFKLNKILNWTPSLYNESDELPDLMPEDLKQYVKMVSGQQNANSVWVSCEGETPADVEYIGPVQYFPSRGFPAYYYPYTNKEGYLSPLVVVLFERPTMGILINIECKAWAKNIFYDRYERKGSVHFELMID